MSSTSRGATRIERDHYPTPDWCTRALCRHIDATVGPPDTILEPCCGEGAVLRVMTTWWPGAKAHGVEVDAGRASAARAAGFDAENENILSWRNTRQIYSLVATNPPFEAAILPRIVEASRGFGRVTAMLLPLSWMLGSNERVEFRRRHPFDILTFGRRPQFVRHVVCKACGWDAWYPIAETDWPQACPACGSKTEARSSDSAEYGWALWGDGMGNTWYQAVLDDEGA